MEEVVTTQEPAQKPQQLTRAQIGQMRRRYITIMHGVVKACGHKAKFSATKIPRSNCVECWRAYFMTSVDLESIHVVLTQRGAKELIKQKGIKFVKAFHGFLAACLLPALASETNNTPAGEPAKIDGGTFANGNQGTEVQNPSITE